jgi:hypothetical protein
MGIFQKNPLDSLHPLFVAKWPKFIAKINKYCQNFIFTKSQQTIAACKACKTQGQYQLLHKKLLN